MLRAHPGEPVPGSLVSAIRATPEQLAVASAAVVEPMAGQPGGSGDRWPWWLPWVLVPVGLVVLAGGVLRALRSLRRAGRGRGTDGPDAAPGSVPDLREGSESPDGAAASSAGPPSAAPPATGPTVDPPSGQDTLPARVDALASRVDDLTGESADLRASLTRTDGTVEWLGSRLEHQENLMTRFHQADRRPERDRW